jgi:hypothetical protein
MEKRLSSFIINRYLIAWLPEGTNVALKMKYYALS